MAVCLSKLSQTSLGGVANEGARRDVHHVTPAAALDNYVDGLLNECFRSVFESSVFY